jgi:hypothetical protein
MLGPVGLLLAFAQTLPAPVRTRSLRLAAYLAIAGRGVVTVVLAAALVAFLLLVTADLDRPTRGLIQVPDTVLKEQLAEMTQSPAGRTP